MGEGMKNWRINNSTGGNLDSEEREKVAAVAAEILSLIKSKELSHIQAEYALECTKALMMELPV